MTSVVKLISQLEEAEPRTIAPEDWRRYESYVGEIFTALGMDLAAPGTRETPRRFLQALHDATAGYDGDPKLRTAFPSERPAAVDGSHSQIIEGPIAFHALCEHHALPFHGVAHVAYIARRGDHRDLEADAARALYARRFTVQERVGEQIADTLVELVQPRGVAVRLEAAHLCTQMRGVAEEGSRTVTTFWRGLYNERPRTPRRVPRRGSGAAADTARASLRAARPAGARSAGGAARSLRRRARLRRAVRLRELRRDDRRRRRDSRSPALKRADLGRERGRPLRDGASARVRGRRARWAQGRCSHRRPGPGARARLPAGRRRSSPSCAAAAGDPNGRPSRSSLQADRSIRTHPALEHDAIVLTTERAAAEPARQACRRPAKSSPSTTATGSTYGEPSSVLRERGHSLILSEGGPTLFGSLLAVGPCR